MNWPQLWQDWQDRLQQRRWRIALSLLLLGPALLLIAWRTYQNWEVLQQHDWTLRPACWAAAFLGHALSLFCLMGGWQLMLTQLGQRRPFLLNARIYCLSNLAKRIPGGIWYIAGRVHLYREQDVNAAVSLSASALELVLLAGSGMVTFFLSLPFSQSSWSAYLGLALAVLLGALFLLQPPVFNRLLRFLLHRLGSQDQLEISYRSLGPMFLLYLGCWITAGAGLYLAILSLYELPWSVLPDIIGLWALSGTLSMLAATFFLLGTGVREIALSFLLVAHMPQPLAVVAAVLFWFVVTIGEVFWGLFFLLGRRRGPGEMT
ncbi:MAG: flippase-like domain-containing protein [Chloroflexia bacterium]|nr:flippase-like domain-containing protein [Chloroflexia bacterium]